MQALDSFISPIAGFEGDIPILVIPVLAWPPGDESTSDPSIGTGASALKTWAGKAKRHYQPDSPKTSQESHGSSSEDFCFNSSIRSSSKDPNLALKKVCLWWVYFLLDDF
jgi:hypothetical protein